MRVILWNLVRPIQRSSLIGCVLRQLTQNHTHRLFITVSEQAEPVPTSPAPSFWSSLSAYNKAHLIMQNLPRAGDLDGHPVGSSPVAAAPRCTRQGRQLRLRPYRRTLPGCEAIVQPCPYKAILQPTGNLCGWRANDAGRDMTFIKIKVFDTCAEIIGYAVLNACTGRPGAIGYRRTGAASRNCETRPQLAGGSARRPVNEVAIKSHTKAATQRCQPWHLTPAPGQYTCTQRLALRGGVVVGLKTPNDRPGLKVRSDLRTTNEPRFVDGRTPPAARDRCGGWTKNTSSIEPNIKATPIVTARDMRGRPLEAAGVISPAVGSTIAAITGTWVGANFLLDADEVAAPRTVLRREHADASAASDLIDRVKNIHDVKAHGHRLMVRHIEIARHADIELSVRRHGIDIGVTGAQPRAIDHVGRESRTVPLVRQASRAGHVLVMVGVDPMRRQVLKPGQAAEISERRRVIEQELVRYRLRCLLLTDRQVGVGLEIAAVIFGFELDALSDALGVVEGA